MGFLKNLLGLFYRLRQKCARLTTFTTAKSAWLVGLWAGRLGDMACHILHPVFVGPPSRAVGCQLRCSRLSGRPSGPAPRPGRFSRPRAPRLAGESSGGTGMANGGHGRSRCGADDHAQGPPRIFVFHLAGHVTARPHVRAASPDAAQPAGQQCQRSPDSGGDRRLPRRAGGIADGARRSRPGHPKLPLTGGKWAMGGTRECSTRSTRLLLSPSVRS